MSEDEDKPGGYVIIHSGPADMIKLSAGTNWLSADNFGKPEPLIYESRTYMVLGGLERGDGNLSSQIIDLVVDLTAGE